MRYEYLKAGKGIRCLSNVVKEKKKKKRGLNESEKRRFKGEGGLMAGGKIK